MGLMKFCKQCGGEYESNIELCPHDGTLLIVLQDEESIIDPMVGQVIDGRYIIERRIGQGGLGSVYMALQSSMSRKVAIKVIRKSLAGNKEVTKRFLREALAASKLNHPNTITVHDFGQTEEGTLFLAMEYLKGMTLGQIIKEEGPLETLRVFRLVDQVCSSLIEAHGEKIVHRDLKPDNVFVLNMEGQGEFVKVLDFGTAKISVDATALTLAGALMGTPLYMSPEQASGERIDHRADIYSLGGIMYHALSGTPPFMAKNIAGLIQKHLMEKPRPLKRLLPPIPVSPWVDSIVLKALEKDPDKRYQTVQELREEIKAQIDSLEAAGKGLYTGEHLNLQGQGEPELRLDPDEDLQNEMPITEPPSASLMDTEPPVPALVDRELPYDDTIGMRQSPGAPKRRIAAIAGVAVVVTLAILALNWKALFPSSKSPVRSARSERSLSRAAALLRTALRRSTVSGVVKVNNTKAHPETGEKTTAPLKVATLRKSLAPSTGHAPPPLVALTIRSVPSRALCYLGKRYKGKTPKTLRIPRGKKRVWITLRKRKYLRAVKSFLPTKDGRLDFKLKRRPVARKKPKKEDGLMDLLP